jgi:hypothetical protein
MEHRFLITAAILALTSAFPAGAQVPERNYTQHSPAEGQAEPQG